MQLSPTVARSLVPRFARGGGSGQPRTRVRRRGWQPAGGVVGGRLSRRAATFTGKGFYAKTDRGQTSYQLHYSLSDNFLKSAHILEGEKLSP
jgi:hypothetical protein